MQLRTITKPSQARAGSEAPTKKGSPLSGSTTACVCFASLQTPPQRFWPTAGAAADMLRGSTVAQDGTDDIARRAPARRRAEERSIMVSEVKCERG